MANKKRKCCYCKDYFPAESGVVINASFFCGMDHVVTHGREKGNKAIERQRAKEKREQLEKEKAFRVKLKADKKRVRTTPRAEALLEAQLLARVSSADDDGYCTCVSCGSVRKWNDWMDGGHFIAKGDSSFWSFDPRNINPQCKDCNNHGMKYGTAAITYTSWMVDKFGQAFVDEMIATKRTPVKRSSVFYDAFIKSAKAKAV